jgi:hypothetical protein
MAIKYTDIFHCKTLQNLPKQGFLVWKSGNPVLWRKVEKVPKKAFLDRFKTSVQEKSPP